MLNVISIRTRLLCHQRHVQQLPCQNVLKRVFGKMTKLADQIDDSPGNFIHLSARRQKW